MQHGDLGGYINLHPQKFYRINGGSYAKLEGVQSEWLCKIVTSFISTLGKGSGKSLSWIRISPAEFYSLGRLYLIMKLPLQAVLKRMAQ